MKRLALAALLLLAAPAAVAETLAGSVQAEASRIRADVDSARSRANLLPALKPKPLAPQLTTDLQRFGLLAANFSAEIDRSGGPVDLRCIFRGMAQETDVQLKAAADARTGAAQADALDRLSHMLRDAAEIAPAAELKPAPGKPQTASVKAAAGAFCPAAKKF